MAVFGLIVLITQPYFFYGRGEECLGNEDEIPPKFIVKKSKDATEACITVPGVIAGWLFVNAGVTIIKEDE